MYLWRRMNGVEPVGEMLNRRFSWQKPRFCLVKGGVSRDVFIIVVTNEVEEEQEA